MLHCFVCRTRVNVYSCVFVDLLTMSPMTNWDGVGSKFKYTEKLFSLHARIHLLCQQKLETIYNSLLFGKRLFILSVTLCTCHFVINFFFCCCNRRFRNLPFFLRRVRPGKRVISRLIDLYNMGRQYHIYCCC